MSHPLPTRPLVPGYDDGDYPTTLEQACRDELMHLWHDLYQARRNGINTGWSMQAESLAYRIVTLTRLVGPTPWGEIQIELLLDGVYERIHQEAGITFEPVDWERVREVQVRIECRTERYATDG